MPLAAPALERDELVCAALAVLLGAVWLLLGGGQGPAPAPAAALHVDVNSASHARLCAVPGIGPTLATRLIRGRPWRDRRRLEERLGARAWARAGPYLSLGSPDPLVSARGAPARDPAAPAGCAGSDPGPPAPPGSASWPR